MRSEKEIRARLNEMLIFHTEFSTPVDYKRGWARALQWVLSSPRKAKKAKK